MSTEEIFKKMKEAVQLKGAQIVPKVKAVFVFDIEGKKWTVDLKNENGSVSEGPAPEGKKVDVTFTVSNENFQKLVKKEAKAVDLVMSRKMTLKGNPAVAMKFENALKALEASDSKL